MTFTRRYLAWLLVPPLVISIPPALLFLTQVMQLGAGRGYGLMALLAVMYIGGCVIFTLMVKPYADAVEEAQAGRGDLSQAMSACLDRTKNLSLLLWGGGGILFALVAAALFMPTPLGFAYFLVASLIAAFPAIIWGYAMGKHRLLEAAGSARVHYAGRGLSLGTKIAAVFIGSLTISAAALILLISSRVSTTLEHLAITSAAERFERVQQSANILAKVDKEALDTLRIYIPTEYSLHLIDPQGRTTATKTDDPLSEDEIRAIR